MPILPRPLMDDEGRGKITGVKRPVTTGSEWLQGRKGKVDFDVDPEVKQALFEEQGISI